MRRLPLLLSFLLALGVLPAGAGLLPVALNDGAAVTRIDAAAANAVMSDNVTYVATIPIDSPGVGGQLVNVPLEDGTVQQRFYVTGGKGLTIYDVTDPALPLPLGFLPLPHFQNEEVAVSEDGSRVIISNDTFAVSTGAGSGGGGVHVIDTSDPSAPAVTGFVDLSNHTTMCADPACEWLYGSSGHIMRVAEDGSVTDSGSDWGREGGANGGHDLNRDASGLIISDSSPRMVLDPANVLGLGGTSFEDPLLIATGEPNRRDFGQDGLLQHNNVRPYADLWVTREDDDGAFDPYAVGDALRPGEAFLSNSESNVNPDCVDAGGLSVWSMANFDQLDPDHEDGNNYELQQLDVFRPFNGDYVSGGNPPANGLGCSGHWFTYSDGLVAASWYEHGVKIFDVDLTGTRTDDEGELDLISQVGFFNPIATQAGASHWIPGPDGEEYIYNVDYARGIDIIKFNREAPDATAKELNESWRANLGQVLPFAAAERYFCRLGAQ